MNRWRAASWTVKIHWSSRPRKARCGPFGLDSRERPVIAGLVRELAVDGAVDGAHYAPSNSTTLARSPRCLQSPAVPVGHLVDGPPGGGLEPFPGVVGNRQQGDLGDRVRDAEKFADLLFVREVQGRPRRAKAPAAQGQLEA